MNRKAALGFLVLLLGADLCFGQTNSPSQEKVVHSLSPLSDSTWKWISATRAKKPLSVLTLTYDVSQASILTITDRLNASCGVDGYADGFCGFGARLSRDYLGRGLLVRVAFAWDQWPKRTIISMYGTNQAGAMTWEREMTKALRERFGAESIQDKGKK